MPGKHAPESSASFVLSLSKAVGGALAAVAIMSVLVVALLNRGEATGSRAGGPAITGPTSSSSPTPTPSAQPTVKSAPRTPAVLAASRVTVQVLNGTARTGLAAATAQEIQGAGYRLAGTGNAPRTAKSTIFYREDRRREALAFQARFPDFTVLKEAPASQTAMIRVVLGADWPPQD